ncbi:FKBP-type peptidyl-prolyl cis-trans isomerase [Shewanella putrefaciens]|uniref:Peptidyl-prolyl cis-trans isomerase n=2 Tax=Shewanella putrefaciens TaxID=24 RepID=E6XKU2_SHEP2|nr:MULTISPECIES: FKBP-type peptidyl-prolyl cis-trans isomerase [Shewanella]ABM23789.1 peptidylprolyl isomerase, FKBP-type [Shewanella sp. W3-18-1]AVV85553.1 peptidyl-prolyl cis-trans isomerase [Shewanella putrefaciens]MCA1895525.1 FKBP-type peptidyl-prolyl cis-trans isomerase [Shewanella putrefaciens]MCK7630174.1 FKBP-type peptidyl-prolyl cis-trans isomerase [Shewanella sp. JNE9-1]MCK7635123.1 FKBP-type peptidyl-prolyl cis-trans isomerase [Shewanella sp. JNE17]
MKSIYKLSLVALAVIGLSACNKEEKATDVGTNVELTTEAQKEAYSVGASIGRYMSGHIKEQEELGLPVDRSLIVTGFTNGLNDQLKLTEEEMQTLLQGLDKKLNDKRQEQAIAISAKNIEEGKKYLEENKAKPGVVTTESGLQYEVLTPGSGEKPAAEDTVEVDYVGTLLDGKEFDSSYKRGQTIKFPLDRVIPGWTEGLQLMPVGAKYKFVIPAELAYGERDNGTIPPNSTLIFEVELKSIEKAQAAPAAEPAKK